MTKTVLIVDDYEPFRDSARGLLESGDFAVVGEAEGGRDALRLAEELHPDVVQNGTTPITMLSTLAPSACQVAARWRDVWRQAATLKSRQRRPTSGEISPNDRNDGKRASVETSTSAHKTQAARIPVVSQSMNRATGP